MDILLKIFKILILLLVIYLWNRIIVKNMIKRLVEFHKKNNVQNLNKQPIKYIIENEMNICNFAAGFYWIGGIIISLGILMTK
jgi:hypothetical protein